MIIFGTRGVTWSGERGEFACPGCGGARRMYVRKTVRRFFTLYFIPVIPLDKIGEYVECQQCRGTYNNNVFDFDPAALQAKQRAEFVEHFKRIMILAAMSKGQISDKRREAMRAQYHTLTGGELSYAEIGKEFALASQAKIRPADYAQRFAGNLNEHGKELVIKAVFSVLRADGPLTQQEQDLVHDLATALNMSSAHYRGILAECEQGQLE
jgi:hypothetical protein